MFVTCFFNPLIFSFRGDDFNFKFSLKRLVAQVSEEFRDALLAKLQRERELTYREAIFARHSLFPPDSLTRDSKAMPKAAILAVLKYIREVFPRWRM